MKTRGIWSKDPLLRFCLGLFLTTGLSFGFVQTSGAATCAVTDVTLGGMNAMSCGAGSGSNDKFGNDISNWSVNEQNAGGINTWSYYEKEPGSEGNTTVIDLKITEGQGMTSGKLSLNAQDPTLIVMKGGNNPHWFWYLFENKTGFQTGTWNMANGHDNSHITAYTTAVPIPAAIWLFGSSIAALFFAGRKKGITNAA